jgi:hypothetical protein
MPRRVVLALPLVLLGAACAPQAPAPAPPPAPAAGAPTTPLPPAAVNAAATPGSGPMWRVTQTSCAQLISLSDDDRAAAVMFYYGYHSATAAVQVIDVSLIGQTVHRVVDLCGRTPNMTIIDAYNTALAGG